VIFAVVVLGATVATGLLGGLFAVRGNAVFELEAVPDEMLRRFSAGDRDAMRRLTYLPTVEARNAVQWFTSLLDVIDEYDRPLSLGIATQAAGARHVIRRLEAALPEEPRA
jgi:hypothetical protein